MRSAKGWQGLLMACCALMSPAVPASGWIEVRDHGVRHEIRRLVDAGRLRLPAGTWPMPTSMLVEAMSRAVEAGYADVDSFDFLGELLADRDGLSVWWSAADTPRLRDPGAAWRDEAEIGLRWNAGPGDPVAEQANEGRWSATAAVSVSRSDEGEQLVRFDDSHITARWGNWQLGASVLDRYWGPGNDGSLILSDNARPMPALALDRATATPFETRWLSWIGPWGASLFVARMESERRDVDRPLFLGARVSAMPRPWLEVGVSRTAQVCGRGRPCSLRTLRDLLIGNDNIGIDATAESEPGNQMAGIDLRIRSPWPRFPAAVYAQVIGEDESSYFPVKNLALYGVEHWMHISGRGDVRAFVEYANTSCSYNRSQPRFDCAYRQAIFREDGYRYRGRVIGHIADADAEIWTLGAFLGVDSGAQWSVRFRDGRINRGGAVDPNHSIYPLPARYRSAAASLRHGRGEHRFDIMIGYERLAPSSSVPLAGLTAAMTWEWRPR